ncbi:UBP1-associated protein like [Melia azedarach]|uniref:UBP1-associated protein like n=1 Tax=Melia azedarach TaxID=155640 RepID=A0ACC1XY18_MELAZ|nr:UBP1-associated protein like [Melia azedarach]
MAKTNKTKKTKQVTTTKKPNKKIVKKEPKSPVKPEQPPATTSSSESDSETESDKLAALLEPYTKDQLINLIAAAAVKSSALYNHIRETADRDVSHRKIFVHGLGWDTTQDDLVSAFESCGEIEECKLVTDKVTGKAKGFAFIVFRTRKSAGKALKNPQRKIRNRMAACQLASVGPTVPPKDQPVGDRKIYVSNVQRDADKEKLRAFFERFGEIEAGPIGFDINTGKSRGFAIFVYRKVEGAKKSLEEPYKMFQGNQLHCQKAAEGKNKTGSSNSTNQVVQPVQHSQHQQQGQGQEQVLAAVAAAQNLALFGQHPGLNPVYGGLLANSGLINPVMAGALNQGVVPGGHVGAMAGPSVPGAGTGQGLQQHAYPNAHQGRNQGAGGGSFPGYTSYM